MLEKRPADISLLKHATYILVSLPLKLKCSFFDYSKSSKKSQQLNKPSSCNLAVSMNYSFFIITIELNQF